MLYIYVFFLHLEKNWKKNFFHVTFCSRWVSRISEPKVRWSETKRTKKFGSTLLNFFCSFRLYSPRFWLTESPDLARKKITRKKFLNFFSKCGPEKNFFLFHRALPLFLFSGPYWAARSKNQAKKKKFFFFRFFS